MSLAQRWKVVSLVVAILGFCGVACLALVPNQEPIRTEVLTAQQPSLAVATVSPQSHQVSDLLTASGDIVAWQEASVSTEAEGLRLATVRVDVGDKVHRGQLLATLATERIQADLAQSLASVAEAEALLADAVENAERAQLLRGSGALSLQQINQYTTSLRTARARLDAAKAAATAQQLRLAQTRVVAPDDGTISVRTAVVGAVVPAGHELFRLIRQGRLEWRAEVAAPDLAKLRVGQLARVTLLGGGVVEGRLRVLAPVVDAATRDGLVYVDLVPEAGVRPGMFAQGVFDLGTRYALTLPEGAVSVRDGFSYVLRVGPDQRVSVTKVTLGRNANGRVEITGGLNVDDQVVAAGLGLLSDGDLVHIIDAPGQTAK